MPEPIEPTLVIPAGWPLPRPAAPTPPPAPPQWPPTPPPAPRMPRPPVPPPAPIDVRIHVEVTLAQPEPEPPTWAERLQLRRNLTCCALAFIPASAWGSVLHQCWQATSLLPAWILAAVAIGLTAAADQRRRGRATDNPTDRGRGTWLTRTALCTALLGPALGLPILGSLTFAVTGVQP